MKDFTLFKRILFCTDFSPEAAAAFPYALSLSEACADAVLIIFHVIPEPDAQFWKTYIYEIDQVDDKAKHDIDRQMQEDYLSRIPDSQHYETRIAVGQAGQLILKTVTEEKIDLIVIGRSESGSAGSFFFSDGTKTALQKVSCPVLIVPDVPVSKRKKS